MNIDFHSFIRSIIKTIEAKDLYTAGHSDRVADLAERTAIRLDLPSHEIEIIHIAGHLHDIGKIGIPEGILLKSGKLNFEEFELLKRHSVIGYEILSEIKGFRKIAACVRSHHERPDGTGYPDHLTEKEIPRGALIITVADAFDAMTTDRVYKKTISVEQAAAEIRHLQGRQFAPFAAEAFLDVIKYL